MKILYLHQYFKLLHESGGTRSYDLATSFIKHGYGVVIVTSTSDEKFNGNGRWHIEMHEGLEIHRIFLPYNNNLSYFERSLIFCKFLYFSNLHLLKLKADLVLATSTPLTIGIPALIKKWLNNTPYVFEVRDVWPEAVIAIGAVSNKWIQKILFKLEKTIYKNASIIVPLSTDMQESIIRRYPEFENKTSTVIENISVINRFGNYTTKIDLPSVLGFNPRFSVLYAGAFGRVNGIHKIVELAEKTLSIDASLVYLLIGSGAMKEDVERMALKYGVLNKNLYIFDSVSKAELPKWYNTVSMGSSFVINIPELWANSANKFFDTLASAKPVLINHEGWQANMIRSRKIGYILPFEITKNAAEDFVQYTQNIDSIEDQGYNALKLAKEKYSLEVATEKYLRIFDSLIGNNNTKN